MTDQQDAYERFIRPIEDQMIRSVWRIVRNTDDVDDAFQDALSKIWKRWDRIQRHSNPRALVLRICINAAYDSLRRKTRDRKIEELQAVGEMIPNPAVGRPDSVAVDEMKAALCAAISRLPKNQGLAIHMRFIEELPYEAIAQALGCREVSARKHVSRAVRKLQVLLPQQANEFSSL